MSSTRWHLTTRLRGTCYKINLFFFSDGSGTEDPSGTFPCCESAWIAVYWVKQMLRSQWESLFFSAMQMETLCSCSCCIHHAGLRSNESEWLCLILMGYVLVAFERTASGLQLFFFPVGILMGKLFKSRQELSQETTAACLSIMGIQHLISLIAAAAVKSHILSF